jgi:ABC-type multidrug transport system permease subunit
VFTWAQVILTFGAEKVVVERERASKSYRLSSFYLGKVAAELPLNLVSPLVFGCVVYWLVGLNPAPGRFFIFLVIMLEVGFASIGLGMAVAAAAPNPDVAQVTRAQGCAPAFIPSLLSFPFSLFFF